MSDFIFSLNATLPVFLLILAGVWFRRNGMFTEEFLRVADKFNYKVTLPILLFVDVANADIRSSFEPSFVLFCIGATIGGFLLSFLAAKLFLKEKRAIGAFSMVGFRSSIAVLGVAFAENIYGNAGPAPLMIAAVVPLYNIFSVVILSIYAEDGEEVVSVRGILRGIFTNPLILAVLFAFPFALFSWTIPAIPLKVLTYFKSIATPLALLVLGGSIQMRSVKERIAPILGASVMKLLVMPVVFLPLAVLLGFRGAELVVVAIMLSSPTTVACYTMARNMNSDHALASGTVVVTTLGSSVTITLVVFLLRTLGLI